MSSKSKVELIVSIGEIIDYESSDGEIAEGEVIEVSEEMNRVKVWRVDSLLATPEWVDADNILLEEDITYSY